MLEPWIIEKLRRREEDRRHRDRPRIDPPVPSSQWSGENEPGMDRDEQVDNIPERGVVIMEMQGRGKTSARSRPTQRRRRCAAKSDR